MKVTNAVTSALATQMAVTGQPMIKNEAKLPKLDTPVQPKASTGSRAETIANVFTPRAESNATGSNNNKAAVRSSRQQGAAPASPRRNKEQAGNNPQTGGTTASASSSSRQATRAVALASAFTNIASTAAQAATSSPTPAPTPTPQREGGMAVSFQLGLASARWFAAGVSHRLNKGANADATNISRAAQPNESNAARTAAAITALMVTGSLAAKGIRLFKNPDNETQSSLTRAQLPISMAADVLTLLELAHKIAGVGARSDQAIQDLTQTIADNPGTPASHLAQLAILALRTARNAGAVANFGYGIPNMIQGNKLFQADKLVRGAAMMTAGALDTAHASVQMLTGLKDRTGFAAGFTNGLGDLARSYDQHLGEGARYVAGAGGAAATVLINVTPKTWVPSNPRMNDKASIEVDGNEETGEIDYMPVRSNLDTAGLDRTLDVKALFKKGGCLYAVQLLA